MQLTHRHHHHILLSLLGHRASTKRRHLILFLASCLTSPQLFPSPNASLWTDLLHVCLGLTLFRCPCGFQSKTSLSMVSCPFLSVCPIQFHFRLLICIDISISSALLQSSSFEITSGQWIFKILRRQRLRKTCSFEIVLLSIRTKLRIFRSNVKSVLLYGSETWKVAKTTNAVIWCYIIHAETCPCRFHLWHGIQSPLL